MLDRTQQRIVGVLVEKELSVPDSYPMTENALVLGCNQKSNRDPAMGLEAFEVHGAVMALQEQDWVARVEGGSRVIKYRHRMAERYGIDRAACAVLAELLLRGPQAPGALKPRVQRMGFHGDPDAIRDLLEALAARPMPLVELLPRQPRERDARWAHRLGERGELPVVEDAVEEAVEEAAVTPEARAAAPAVPPAAAPTVVTPQRPPAADDRVTALEARVAALERALAELRAGGAMLPPD